MSENLPGAIANDTVVSDAAHNKPPAADSNSNSHDLRSLSKLFHAILLIKLHALQFAGVRGVPEAFKPVEIVDHELAIVDDYQVFFATARII